MEPERPRDLATVIEQLQIAEMQTAAYSFFSLYIPFLGLGSVVFHTIVSSLYARTLCGFMPFRWLFVKFGAISV